MLDRIDSSRPSIDGTPGCVPKLTIKKLGIVSRDYNREFENGYYDFSHVLPGVLKLLDDKGCDAALFSLYSIILRWNFNVRKELSKLQLEHLKAVSFEEFHAERKGNCDSLGPPVLKLSVIDRTENGKSIESGKHLVP